MELSKDSKVIVNRLLDLANKSYRQNMFTFTDFMSEGDLSLFYDNIKEFQFVKYTVFGGMDDAERNIIRFGDEEELGYIEEFPIVCLCISPVLAKFSDELGHRDYLGSLMNLGIERSVLGDIVIKDKKAYLFCKSDIKDYIVDNLYKIKHTNVKLEEVQGESICAGSQPVLKEILVPSMRVDVIISSIYNKSRSQAVVLFREHKVFVNGRLYENNSGVLKENDLVSVRGYGRFRYIGIVRNTSKGKYILNIQLF